MGHTAALLCVLLRQQRDYLFVFIMMELDSAWNSVVGRFYFYVSW